MISCPGRACLKLDRCCKLESSKEWISVKARAVDLAVAKNGWRPNWHLILLWLMSEEFCKQPWDKVVLDPSLVPPEEVHDGVEGMGVGKEGQKRGKRVEQWNLCCTDSLWGFYCWCWSLRALFRKLCFSGAFIGTWKHHGVCICVPIAALGDNAPKGTRFCQVLGT